MKSNPNYIGSTAPSIHEWYNEQIRKYREELSELNKKIYEATQKYIQHMYCNTRKGYNLTKRENLSERVRLTKEFKKDYQDLQNEYLRLQTLITRKYFVEETLNRLSHDRKVHYEQLRKQVD